ncbi:MAG TPA: hypothetical protein VMV84_07450 [Dehalococcoidales bacterium]|nr:hypothetical protein [Dehalococcoidales bacterium]
MGKDRIIATIYLTPFIPLSYQGEGEIEKREASSLLDSPLVFSLRKERKK